MKAGFTESVVEERRPRGLYDRLIDERLAAESWSISTPGNRWSASKC
jgi:hypothetical protein